jgi:hypothetical protein
MQNFKTCMSNQTMQELASATEGEASLQLKEGNADKGTSILI